MALHSLNVTALNVSFEEHILLVLHSLNVTALYVTFEECKAIKEDVPYGVTFYECNRAVCATFEECNAIKEDVPYWRYIL